MQLLNTSRCVEQQNANEVNDWKRVQTEIDMNTCVVLLRRRKTLRRIFIVREYLKIHVNSIVMFGKCVREYMMINSSHKRFRRNWSWAVTVPYTRDNRDDPWVHSFAYLPLRRQTVPIGASYVASILSLRSPKTVRQPSPYASTANASSSTLLETIW